MIHILLDGTKVKVYNILADLCEYCRETKEWRDELWSFLLLYQDLYDEFIYYLQTHSIRGNTHTCGYTLLDLYVKQIDLFNIRSDLGKNPPYCNKEDMVLRAFYMMGKMKNDPEAFSGKLDNGFGMDRL